MRSLVITPAPTHPTTEGNRARVRQIAQALRRRGTVELLYVPLHGAPAEGRAGMQAAWDMMHFVPPPAAPPRRRVPGRWRLDEWVEPQAIEAARFLAATARYDVVVAHYVFCSLLLEPFRGTGALLVLDTHDRVGGRHEAARAEGLPAHWFSTTSAEEATGLARADVVLAIQEQEAGYFRTLTQRPVEVVEYATATAFLPQRGRAVMQVGFVGSANPLNIDNIAAFDALLAARALPPAEFLLFGGIAGQAPGLRVFQSAGRFDQPADAYAGLDIAINPARGGSGQKIKTVEALAHGRATLSTRAGGAGLEWLHPDLQHADPAALLDRLVWLLERPAEIEALAAAMSRRYEVFCAGVQGRLDALVNSWADRV